MTRRSLIRRVLLILASGPAWLAGCMARARDIVSPGVVPAAKTGALSTAEMDTLIAFGEVIVEGRTLAPTERRILADYIEDRTEKSAEHLWLYRMAASTLDRAAGRQFASLGLWERRELIEREGLGGRRAQSEADLGVPATLRALWTRTVPDLIRGYYRSAAGWAVVGYETFPGRCGDLMRYTRRES